MAKITEESRERFETRTTPYRELIKKYQAREKMLLDKIKQSESGTALTKIQLVEDAIYIATIYIIINKVSVAILETKNNEALEQARKSIMRANIYLGEVVTKLIDAPYSEYSEKLEELDSYSVEKRFYLVSKLANACCKKNTAGGKTRCSFRYGRSRTDHACKIHDGRSVGIIGRITSSDDTKIL